MAIIKGSKIIAETVEEVLARRYILESLIEGSKTGKELHKRDISDPQLYYNLKKLEDREIITSQKIWRTRHYKINPEYIQPVRDFLKIIKPYIIIFSVSDPSEVRVRINNILRKYNIQFQKIILIAKKSSFRGARPISNATIIFVDDATFENSLTFARNEIEQLILEYINSYEIVFDLTYFGYAMAIAIVNLCFKYSLKCLTYNNKLVWIQNK